MKEKITAILSPYHDPSGKLISELRPQISILKSIFDIVGVSVSDKTDPRVLKEFDLLGVHYKVRVEDGSVSGRYTSALKLGTNDNVDVSLLIDFDRALHWAKSYPDELLVASEQLKNSEGFVAIGRTQRAFETHPLTQRQTEAVINQIASELVGKRIDILSGAYGLDKKAADVVIKKANKIDYSFYGQILAVCFQSGLQINSIEAEGLEWETPDQYKDQINILGYSQWLNDFQSLEEWEKRLTLAFEAGQALQI